MVSSLEEIIRGSPGDVRLATTRGWVELDAKVIKLVFLRRRRRFGTEN